MAESAKTGLPVRERTQTGPKEFFLWLAATAALYVSVTSLVALLFEYIDRLFGDDPFAYIDPLGAGIRIAVASLIIIFPLYVWFMRMLHNDMRANPEKRDLWVRRWLLVLTLFIAGIVLVIDLIVLINTFLGGEVLTAAFLLKVLTVLVVVGGAFWYYINEIRGAWEKKEQTSKMIAGGASLVVFVAVAAAFFIVGSPGELRALRYDQQKVNDLSTVQSQVTRYWQQKEALPASLTDLEDPLIGFRVPEDPQAGEGSQYAYTYRQTDNLTFELCAVFNAPSPESAREIAIRDPFGGGNFFEHGAGEECFERTIDPDQFPSLKEAPALLR